MNTRDIRVTDVTHRAATRSMIEPDQRAIDILLERSQIPPLDGAVPEPTDYYSLGAPAAARLARRQIGRMLVVGVLSIGFGLAVGYICLALFGKVRL